MHFPRIGSCLCGEVGVTLNAAPVAVGACHCLHCRATSGSAFSLIAIMHIDAVEVRGDVKVYHDVSDGGEPRERRFCSTCGSPVETQSPENEAQGLTVIKLGLFEDINDLVPVVETFGSRRAAWLPEIQGAICFATMPPATA